MAKKYTSFSNTHFPGKFTCNHNNHRNIANWNVNIQFHNNVSLGNRITSSQVLFNEISRRHQTEMKEINELVFMSLTSFCWQFLNDLNATAQFKSTPINDKTSFWLTGWITRSAQDCYPYNYWRRKQKVLCKVSTWHAHHKYKYRSSEQQHWVLKVLTDNNEHRRSEYTTTKPLISTSISAKDRERF